MMPPRYSEFGLSTHRSYQPESGQSYLNQHTDNMAGLNLSANSSYLSDADVIKCNFCPMMFARHALYTLHMSSAHPDLLPFMCISCKKGFQTKTGYKLHMQAHSGRTFVCPSCQATFKLKHHLKRHLDMVHKLSQCNKCQAVFDKQTDFNAHLAHCS